MREARIILPAADNDGNPLANVHHDLKVHLCNTFGGYTQVPVSGGWVDETGKLYEEPGFAYDIAMSDELSETVSLKNLARTIGYQARQKAMYVRYPNGIVEIIDTDQAAQAA